MKKSLLTVLLLCSICIGAAASTPPPVAHASSLGGDLYGIAGGTMTSLSSTDLNKTLGDFANLGSRWVRFDFAWPYIQPTSQSSYNWTDTDRVTQAAISRRIKVIGILDYTPTWELPSGCTDIYHCVPRSNADYATFAAAVVARYAPMGVHTWELWNEPNGGTFSPARYVGLIRAAYPAMKQKDSTAFILGGATQPAPTGNGEYSPVDFLSGIYQSGGGRYFDAVSHHPYCYAGTGFNCPTQFATWSAWSQMQDTNPSMRSVMVANGDSAKKIWATEFGAPTSGSSQAVSLSQQAQMVHDAYTLFGSYSWGGPLLWYSYRDHCTDLTNNECNFGLLYYSYTQKPSYGTYQNLARAA